MAQRTLETPLGRLLAIADASGVQLINFVDSPGHSTFYSSFQDSARATEGDIWLRRLEIELERYFASPLTATYAIPHSVSGTPFQRAVWQTLLTIPAGQTTSYGCIARRLSKPNSARAVGAAVGRNPLLLVFPCHRVIASDGGIAGYRGGVERKKALLQLEGGR